ncbi:Alpha-13-mannosyl-glycoprotein 2-beta-N-acetylglucosaminyltransferase [Taenia crassiceps]|uniref:Alpha-1,3-mannosyl-glycoprotein 2-beta-N-acetylglucosaminyltransferase n=1 Tax=Taenia crassiceps TaxID=6207 RepID=A0ABR4QMK3_9CEST
MNRSLSHLIEYRRNYLNGSWRFPIYVSHDCNDVDVSALLLSYGDQITILHQPDRSEFEFRHISRNLVGYYRISRNYKWSLSQMFDELKYNLSIIVEDDLDVAPDFFDYFSSLAPLLLEDKSLFCISAWNDNGLPTLIDKSRNDLLYRSDFFPGLGWMLTRQLWDEELRRAWPMAYWDEFMRKRTVRRGRACIRPEVSRSHTFGRKGVSNGQFFDTYLRFNYLNDKPFAFNSSLLRITLKPNVYDSQFLTEVYNNSVLLNDSSQLSYLGETSSQTTPCRLEYKTRTDFVDAARLLGAMEDFKEGVPRTAYMGIVSVFFHGRRIYLAPGGSRGWGNNEYPEWKTYDVNIYFPPLGITYVYRNEKPFEAAANQVRKGLIGLLFGNRCSTGYEMLRSRPSKKKLHMKLQNLGSFSSPKQHLEQYPTSAHVAGDILFDIQTRHGALGDKIVGDLGCGPGILALGAHLLGARKSGGKFSTRIDVCYKPGSVRYETKGIDIKFLKAALNMSREHVYSLHKTATREYIVKTVQDFGANCEVIAELRFDIPKLYKKHRQTFKDIAVDLVHSWFEEGVS